MMDSFAMELKPVMVMELVKPLEIHVLITINEMTLLYVIPHATRMKTTVMPFLVLLVMMDYSVMEMILVMVVEFVNQVPKIHVPVGVSAITNVTKSQITAMLQTAQA